MGAACACTSVNPKLVESNISSNADNLQQSGDQTESTVNDVDVTEFTNTRLPSFRSLKSVVSFREDDLENLPGFQRMLTLSETKSEPNDRLKRSSKNLIDFAIFSETDHCTGDTPNSEECASVKRVIYALKYYMMMTKKMDKEGISTFIDFIKSIYNNYLNDVAHLTETHGSDLEDIHKSLFNEYGFKHCDLKKCKLSGRHSSVNGTEKEETRIPINDPLSNFIVNSFDSVHFYLFHLFDVGLRTFKADRHSQRRDDDEIESEDETRFDRAFSEKKKKLKAVRHELNEYFKRYEGEENKFVISGQTGELKETGNTTYSDRFIATLTDSGDGRQRLKRYFIEHGFDTEAIRHDVGRYPNAQNSNIFGVVHEHDDETGEKIAYFVNRRRRTFCCSLDVLCSFPHCFSLRRFTRSVQQITLCFLPTTSPIQRVQHGVHVDVLAIFCTERR